ncbi:MAG: nucleotidyltransferase [Chitinispirillaceae bacterium]|nr:nucleotidyltransferase [Chitinispirillaceae bacterium]
MNTQQDFEELLKLLENNSVRYMIVGGYAVAFHGFPRLTKDIDFYFDSSNDNVKNIIISLVGFGFPEKDLNFDMFTSEGNIITFGIEPVRVDFLNQISGVDFEDAWNNKVRGKYGNVEVNFIGRTQLIKNKTSTDRPKDKIDAEELLQ